ncbi:MAG: DUF1236 domain-containing protein [Rhodomicrobium sp.]
MHVYIKYGASVVALLATLSLAQAQTERQGGGEKGGEAVEHAQPERGKEGGAKERAPTAQERGKGETHASPTKEKQPAEHREGERKAQDKKKDQRQSNAVSAVARKPNIHISGVQKTKLHDAVSGSTAIRRYRASEIHFTVEVGTRVPDDVIFYDAPVQFIDIDPEFSGYKIVVLDDEILVIDPETREIVEIIPI